MDPVNGFGLAASAEGRASGLRPSSMPVVASETLSAETSAQPPLQVPLSYAYRSIVILRTLSGLMPGRWFVSSSFSSSV